MRVLIADDDADFRALLHQVLMQWGYEVVVCRDGDEAWQVLRGDNPPTLAILDWQMPGLDGVEVCRKVRREIGEPYIYLILLTSLQGDHDLIIGMEAGADDYLTKPVRIDELRVRLRAGRRIVELQNELLATRDLLRDKASHDSLTGLWNHEEIFCILRQELARGERLGDCLSVIMVDIDHFKRINDSYGHMVGDDVLRSTVERMHALVRSYDFIGRYGGEEFLFVLPECCRECTLNFAERLRRAICSTKIDLGQLVIPVSISLGVASSGRNGRSDAETLIKAADAALYRAKQRGRNRVEVAASCDCG